MKVSVIIPVYNGEKYISQAIESCLIQEEVGEVIIIDDASIDGTADILASFKFNFNRVLVFTLEKNMGVSNARNFGIFNASCELISFLDADDYYLKGRFQLDIHLLTMNQNIDGTYGAVKNIIEKDAKYSTEFERNIIDLEQDILPEKLADFVLKDNKPFFSIHSLVLRKDRLLNSNINFDVSLKLGEDIDFIYAVVKKLRLSKIDGQIFIMRRLHSSNTTSILSTNGENRFYIMEKWFHKALKGELSPYQTLIMLYRKASHECHKNKVIIPYYSKTYAIIKEIWKHPKLLYLILLPNRFNRV
ncbi:MAG TPA: glycosyltransferase family 2 protein [Saprospiraceae bacterium]|nr:glycosyltransferase family 2 protein [Saprospiraceae bacterium]HPN69358.1 glycosyltransferase family 2 protein [Saprospiraceae bacterium]